MIAAAGERNEFIDRYIRMYNLDPYEGPQAAGEYRVSLPMAHDLVEKLRALIMTRAPIFTVPPGSANLADQERAQKIEKYLDGAAYRMNLHKMAWNAEWWAMCAGIGLMRLTYDSLAAEDEFPLLLMVPDPRTCYWAMDAREDRFVELIHTWERPRGEIEDEWGVTLSKPAFGLDEIQAAAWDDQKIRYIEYWFEDTDWETVDAPIETEESPVLMADLVQTALDAQRNAQTNLMPEDIAGALSGGEDYAGPSEDAAEKEPPKPKKIRRRVRKVIHAVIAVDRNSDSADEYGAVMIKRPVIMPHYTKIPFFKFSGNSTPQGGAKADMSPLFPLSNGASGKKSIGVLQGMNLLASVDLETAVSAPNSPLFTDDEKLIVDFNPNAVNKVSQGTKVFRVPPDATNPAALRVFSMFEGQVNRVGIPEVYSGQAQSLSGQAIAGFASVFQMLIGSRQVDHERSLSSMMELALCLTKYYSADRGAWKVWGTSSKTGRPIEATITGEDIGDTYRVQAKLSASMPKDTAAMASLLSALLAKNQISHETFLDMLQKLPDFGLQAESPADEMQRIIRDKILQHPDFMRYMASTMGEQFLPFLMGGEDVTPEMVMRARMMLYPEGQQQQQPPGGPNPGQQQMPGNPMQMPLGAPGAIAPGTIPQPPGVPSPVQLGGPPQVSMPGGGGMPPVPGPFQATPGG